MDGFAESNPRPYEVLRCPECGKPLELGHDCLAGEPDERRLTDGNPSSRHYVAHYEGERKQTWRTPRAMFDALHAEYGFTMDGASDTDNALLPKAMSGEDVFVSWAGERVFCNPPWNRIPEFVELAGFADLAVLLVPARVNTRWFHRALELGATPRFFLGRPSFEGITPAKGHNSPVDCLLLVFA